MPTAKEKIITECRRIEEDSLHSGKGHYNAATCWRIVHYAIGIPIAIAAAVTSGAILAENSTLALWLSALVTVATAVTTFLNPHEKASAHYKFGNSFNSLKNRARILREVEIEHLGDVDASARLKELDEQRSKLNSEAPPIPRFAFLKAKRGVKDGESQYAVDAQRP